MAVEERSNISISIFVSFAGFVNTDLLRSAQQLLRQPRSIFVARKSPFVDCNVRVNAYRTSFITDIRRSNGTVDFSFEIVYLSNGRNVIRRYRLTKLTASLILSILSFDDRVLGHQKEGPWVASHPEMCSIWTKVPCLSLVIRPSCLSTT